MTPENRRRFRSMPRWQRLLGFFITVPIFPVFLFWTVLATFFQEIANSFVYVGIEVRGAWSELRDLWREAIR